MENSIVAQNCLVRLPRPTHYDSVAEVVHTKGGIPVGVNKYMARITDTSLDSIIYLYPSVEAALRGDPEGGAGFIVAQRSEVNSGYGWFYAVTNAHVIEEALSPVIRLNTKEGGIDVIPLALNNWVCHPAGDDVAVAQLVGNAISAFKFSYIQSSLFVTPEVIDILDIGPGDDVYMVGRFVHHEGKKKNKPTVRSGIIGLMPDPDEGIEFHEGGFKQEAFLVEMRSISGFSGSPVLFRMPLMPRQQLQFDRPKVDQDKLGETYIGPWLIGIDCGKFRIYDEVYEVEKRGGKKFYKETSLEAKGHSGYSIVVPAWKLQELLDIEVFDMQRKNEEKQIAESKQRSSVELDAIKPKGGDITQEGFNDALKRASRKLPSEPESEKNET